VYITVYFLMYLLFTIVIQLVAIVTDAKVSGISMSHSAQVS